VYIGLSLNLTLGFFTSCSALRGIAGRVGWPDSKRAELAKQRVATPRSLVLPPVSSRIVN
jgi:hypothetical protein